MTDIEINGQIPEGASPPRIALIGGGTRLALAHLAIAAGAGPLTTIVINRDDDRERMLRGVFDEYEPLAFELFAGKHPRGRPTDFRVIQLLPDPDKSHFESPRPLTKRQRRRLKGKCA
ncbi:hypothetical protein WBP07_18005 [Novosphingobium sp. BL-8A]|uniref:hypothetical protein n=1 Tax=Novosphingobium sp. BL-8A TaxID=3127639 RepID=UPI003756E821